MAVNCSLMKLLMREGIKKKYSGNILTIGKQTINITKQELFNCAEDMNYDIKNYLNKVKDNNINENIDDNFLFKALGFENVDSMDMSNYENATILQDLNDDISKELLNKFDVIFDGGSSEHIFNIPKVFENYNKMLKVGGRIVHIVASSGNIDHGLYMFSPTLFHSYYIQNNWKVLDSLFIKYHAIDKSPWQVYEYKEDIYKKSIDGNIPGMWMVMFIAEKNKNSTYNSNIQQSAFLNVWNNENIKDFVEEKLYKCEELNNLKEIFKNNQNLKLILFGASNYGKIVFEYLIDKNISVDYFCDNDEGKWGTKFIGLDIISPYDLCNLNKQDTYVLITSTYVNEIQNQLIQNGIINIISLNSEKKVDDNGIRCKYIGEY